MVEKKTIRDLAKNLIERDHKEDQHVDRRIIFK
jgi:hypothetical protein